MTEPAARWQNQSVEAHPSPESEMNVEIVERQLVVVVGCKAGDFLVDFREDKVAVADGRQAEERHVGGGNVDVVDGDVEHLLDARLAHVALDLHATPIQKKHRHHFTLKLPTETFQSSSNLILNRFPRF